ncbi:MAG: adenylate/guanylate cyclase domain-containing protein [Saprospiraceae bacterium]|nr:adenylate/guanylate cyclase domain-containing protein [Saprospiraceae bacterium]
MNFFTNLLSIRSRILLMLLSVSILSSLVLIVIGYNSGQKAIREGVYNQLTSIRSAKAYQVESYFKQIDNILTVYGHDEMMFSALREFKQAFRSLYDDKVTEECNQLLSKHYETFSSKVAANMTVKDNVEMYYPNTAEACYLQYNYILQNPNPLGEKDVMDYSPNDKSEYANVHRKYHKVLRDIVKKFNFYDLFLVDLESGNVIYSVYKETDFATNFYTGPYKDSNLADLIRRLKKSSDIDHAQIVDFEAYRPSYGAPAAFMGITLAENTITEGALIIQLPVDEVNKIMTGNKNWKNDGLGDSGETYLVGDDFLMRSTSRFFLQDTVGFKEGLNKIGISTEEVDKMYKIGSTILNLPIKTAATKAAFKGEINTIETDDYRFQPVISSFQPLKIDGLSWAIFSEKDVSEAFAPIAEFKHKVIFTLCGIILIVSFLSMWFSERFVRPIIQLNDGVTKISQGESDFDIKVDSKDEIGNLANTFNQMVQSQMTQQKTIKTQNAENERLLLNFMPDAIAKRYKSGEQNIVEHHSNTSIIYADLSGFSLYAKQFEHQEALDILNKLVKNFDEAATKMSIEKIRTVGDGYLAACGLHISRLDHQKRVVEFGFEMRRIVQQFNMTHSTKLGLNIGIDSGEVVGGIVGSEKFVYDVWGDTVNNAVGLRNVGVLNEILVSEAVKTRLVDLFDFEKLTDKTGIYKAKIKG